MNYKMNSEKDRLVAFLMDQRFTHWEEAISVMKERKRRIIRRVISKIVTEEYMKSVERELIALESKDNETLWAEASPFLDKVEEEMVWNLPEATLNKDDYKYFASLASWSIRYSTVLLLDRNPEIVTPSALDKSRYPRDLVAPFHKAYSRLLNQIIKVPTLDDEENPPSPAEVIEWAESIDIDVPRDLEEAVLKQRSEAKAAKRRRPRTQIATEKRQMSKEQRRQDLVEFIGEVYAAGKNKNIHWAVQQRPIPFAKADILPVFQERYPEYEDLSPS